MESIDLNRASQKKISTISHALSILNDATTDSADEIRELMRTEFKQLSEVFTKLNPEFREAMLEIKKATLDSVNQAKSKTVDAAKTVDQSVRKNVWASIGGIAVTSLVFGLLLGRKAR